MEFGEGMFGVTEMRGGGGTRVGEQAGIKGLLESCRTRMTAKVIKWEEPGLPIATAYMSTNCSCVLQSPTQEFLGEGPIARVHFICPQADLGSGGVDQVPLVIMIGNRHHYYQDHTQWENPLKQEIRTLRGSNIPQKGQMLL